MFVLSFSRSHDKISDIEEANENTKLRSDFEKGTVHQRLALLMAENIVTNQYHHLK